MQYKILNSSKIRRYRPKRKKETILIRLLEPYYQTTGIKYNSIYLKEYKAVLDVFIDDIREDNELTRKRFILFNEVIANEIIEFINSNSFDELIVYSNFGNSRSPAVMIGIAKHLQEHNTVKEILNNELYNPNELILSVFSKIQNQL